MAQLEALLIDAVSEADARRVESLLCRGANPNGIIRDGVAAVHLSSGKESEKGLRCLKLLLQHGADPNLRSSEDLTPLHIAASWGCFQNLRLLLRNGGNPNLTDQDGNKPSDLAEQEENSKCASLLQEYESHTSKEEHDVPKFQYSILSGQAMSDSSFSPEASVLIPPGAEPLSSTRLSSLSRQSGKPLNRESQAFWLSDMSDLESHDSHIWNNSEICKELPILSSTCLSVVDNKANPELISENQHQATDIDCDVLQSQNSPVRSQQENRRSVTFRGTIDYLPIIGQDDHLQFSLDQSSDLTLDLSEYPDFLDNKRMAAVLKNQGIDVTYPDDVFIFSKEVDTLEDEFDKTVVGPVPHDDDDDDNNDDDEFKSIIQPLISSGSSEYNSCGSDPYQSPTEGSVENGFPSSKDNGNSPLTQPGAQKSESTVGQSGLVFSVKNVRLSFGDGNRHLPVGVRGHIEEASLSAIVGNAGKVEVASNETVFPSPFVTGRTRSRLSHHSERISQKLASLQTSSCLFEQTLPTVTRLRRNTVKSSYGTSKNNLDEDGFNGERKMVDVDLQLSSLKLSVSSDGQSQADTQILSESMADTVLISERSVESQLESSASEACNKVITTVCYKGLVDHLTDVQEVKQTTTETSQLNHTPVGNKECCVSCGLISQGSLPFKVNSSQSPSSLTYESPKAQKNPCANSGRSGCTPRYSMSRLSVHSSRQTLANLSCTLGGQPLTTDTDELVEYLYTDTEEGHKLIETHVPPTANTSFSSSTSTSNFEDTLLYDWRSLQLGSTSPDRNKESCRPKQDDVGVSGLTDKELRNKLIEMGEDPGPINSQTRPLYVRKLKRSLQNPRVPLSPTNFSAAGYSPELENALHKFLLPNCQADELALCEQFDKPDQNKSWREGFIKSSFNYLLLDPRVTKNLPYRSQSMIPKECFQTFINAVFYVGKGKRSRPYSHLYEALEYFKGDKTSKKLCSKVQHILQVWNAGHGVISLHCFQNVIAVEAYTREACMVDAIGLKMLTNQKRGDYYGVVSTWSVRRKLELGVHLLYRAMQIFLAEGERQLRPADIR
ncbi:ankyrin repeat and LEM domain-containing protein 1 isoform X1 [Pimephales promelas]|uniref:ankyrin repeat and LEM domain-containing protein 1 isoform X1 n=1 Tax=Pimephales promelas TaxID=90988 RepID=UPI0019554B66|nr:ankyrin repeat and LEM domain-containing protein 1 isoform X1 [Pimephales promelas]KAG1935266.1 ankyrin repeat and LEM domain-containing protein [Pimephales promelas]